ncbi:PEP-CTERM sorting domain-containing protein [Roseibacillus ishigakijimensis]|uniref:PEP-CTERM sorting domain-containing protein n=1 Tax=Roseibacillus ishigakijimensis TaxID=454146 RepID=A0A934VIT1_9BACT|nr:PEP-CTERM sorting domain-containing protein [Roseibacillus ishigakijimensis]MBK1835398.1 PEP-CTERM sorting domain-containing protein [Roseibacillus ishigakijimensis]
MFSRAVMAFARRLLFSQLILLGSGFASSPGALPPVDKEPGAEPESSVAILIGGLLWFLLLRKRN